MAINHLGRQVVRESENAKYSGTAFSQADANMGLLAQYSSGGSLAEGTGAVTKTSAKTDSCAGVVLNVSEANITSSTVPPLDPHGTVPGGKTLRLGKQGLFILEFASVKAAADVGTPVVPAANGVAETEGSLAVSDNVIGYLVSPSQVVGGKNYALASINV